MNDIAEKIPFRIIPKKKVDHYINLAVGGNQEARSYLLNFMQVLEAVDDVIDGDADKMSRDAKRMMFFNLSTNYSMNPFVLQNFAGLTALHVVVFNAWIASDEVKEANDSPENKIYGKLLADLYGELFCYVGFLTGGYGRMLAVSKEIRLEYLNSGEEMT